MGVGVCGVRCAVRGVWCAVCGAQGARVWCVHERMAKQTNDSATKQPSDQATKRPSDQATKRTKQPPPLTCMAKIIL